MDARPILGLPEVRPPFLVDLSAAESREGQAGRRRGLVTDMAPSRNILTNHRKADEEDDLEDEDDFDDDDSDDDGADDDDDEDEEEETWQVGRETDSAKRPLWLDFGY
jgi:hypothetical protein